MGRSIRKDGNNSNVMVAQKKQMHALVETWESLDFLAINLPRRRVLLQMVTALMPIFQITSRKRQAAD